MIASTDLTGVDPDLALRIIAAARAIAPGLEDLPDDGTEGKRAQALAILRAVAAEARDRGSRQVRSQRIGPAAVEYSSSDSWFSSDDRAALRALLPAGSRSSGRDPVGHFPMARPVGNLWPEHYDD